MRRLLQRSRRRTEETNYEKSEVEIKTKDVEKN
jgi:hypothetical protein